MLLLLLLLLLALSLWASRLGARSLLGAIYLGRVAVVSKALDAGPLGAALERMTREQEEEVDRRKAEELARLRAVQDRD